jgi:lipopolysaccharide export system permease protein
MLRYVLGEMIPTFFLGVIIFVFILLMFQALRLTEFVLVHGVKITIIAQMMAFLATSFLPVLFPMSLLFTVLLTYGRLSSDSEIVAFRAIGLSMPAIITPAVLLGVLIGLLSLQTTFYIAPWGNRQFEILVTKVGSAKPGATLKEGTFSEGFFDLVVYANKVDSKNGKLSEVFIYDEREEPPITVIAHEGHILQDPEHPGNSASLRLNNGSVHRTSEGRHTKVDFSSYDIFLNDPVTEQFSHKSPQSLTVDELKERLADDKLKKDDRLELETEFHTRTSISFACLLFALIGVGLGTVTNKRNVKSGGMVICLAIVVAYYLLFVTAQSASKQGQFPPLLAMWFANGIFSIAAFFSLRRAWR